MEVARRLDACRSQAAPSVDAGDQVCDAREKCTIGVQASTVLTNTPGDRTMQVAPAIAHLLDLELDWIGGDEQGGRVNHEWRRLRKRTARLLAPCGTARGNGDSL